MGNEYILLAVIALNLFKKDFYTDKQLEKNLGEAFFNNSTS